MKNEAKRKKLSDIAKEKANEFLSETKNAIEDAEEIIKDVLTEEKVNQAKTAAVEFASDSEEKLKESTERAKEDLQEASKKTKSFVQNLFKKEE